MGTSGDMRGELPGHDRTDGIQERFAAFVRDNTGSLFATARLLTGGRDPAEDLLQDVFTRLLPRWDSVEAADNQLAYVRRALVNSFISSTRRAASRELIVDHDTITALTNDAHSAADHAEAVAVASTITPLLHLLSERQRAALVLRYFHQYTDTEIGDAIGCRRGSARSLISRGLDVLRAGLDFVDPDTDHTTARGADR